MEKKISPQLIGFCPRNNEGHFHILLLYVLNEIGVETTYEFFQYTHPITSVQSNTSAQCITRYLGKKRQRSSRFNSHVE